MAAGAVIGAIGVGLTAYGMIKGSQAKADAAREQAKLDGLQADEILRRATVNIRLAHRDARGLRGAQTSGFARSGVDVGSGSALEFMEETASRAREDIANLQLDAAKNAANIRLGAASLDAGAGKLETAGQIGAAGTLLTGAAKFGDATGAFGKA